LGSTAVTSPQYDATAKTLTVPFSATQSISLTVNGTPSKTIEPYVPIQAQGRVSVRHTDRGMELTIPRMTGINQNSKATVAIFDMMGRNSLNKECILKQYASTPVLLELAKGASIAKVEVSGINAGTIRIVTP
jgi:hypothetical protein